MMKPIETQQRFLEKGLCLAIAMCMVLAGCATTPTPIGVPPVPTISASPRYGDAFTLRGGQEVRFTVTPPTAPAAELLVRFVEVVSDERCPARVTCAWANPPVIVLEAAFAGQPPKRYTIKGNYNINRVQFGGVAIEFIDLNPVPQQPEEFAKVKPLSTYTVTLRVSGARVE